MTLILLLALNNAFAGSICNDGWVSDSTGSGTCSHHGGVAAGGALYYPPYSTTNINTDLLSPCVLTRLESDAEKDAWVASQTQDSLDAEEACIDKELASIKAEREYLLAHPPAPPNMNVIDRSREIFWQHERGSVNPSNSHIVAEAEALFAALVKSVGKDNALIWAEFATSSACSVFGENRIIVKNHADVILVLVKGEQAKFISADPFDGSEAEKLYNQLAEIHAPICVK